MAKSRKIEEEERKYTPSKTVMEFHASNAFVRGIMGPFGSGKTTACAMDVFVRARMQEPFEGVRRLKCAVVRNTYPELESTTLDSITQWFDFRIAEVRKKFPIIVSVRRPLEDGTQLELDYVLLSMDRIDDLSKLKGFEVTMAWLNEACELRKDVFDYYTGRVGRYPPIWLGGPSWRGIIMDTNPPNSRHWYYHMAEVTQPEGWKFFKQPGGLIRTPDGGYIPNPEAENIDYLVGGYSYYMQMLPEKRQAWIDAFVLGEYARIVSGRPVYEGFWRDSFHVSDTPLEPMHGLPLYLGWDFGLQQACVVCQLTPRGQLRVLREYHLPFAGTQQFVDTVVKPAFAQEFQGMKIVGVGDPTGAQRSQANELTPFEVLSNSGFPTKPGTTNLVQPRIDSVISFLTRVIDGEPAILLDKRCTMLREGFLGDYQYREIQTKVDYEMYKDEPLKNEYSHFHDSLQYVCTSLDPRFANKRNDVDNAPIPASVPRRVVV